MKGSFLAILGLGLPIILMMMVWQYLTAAPAPSRVRPASRPAAPAPTPTGDPNRLMRFEPAQQPPATRPAERAESWSDLMDQWLDQAEKTAREHPDVQRKSAALLLGQQRFDAAAEAFDRLLVKNPNDPTLLTGKAMALSATDRHDDALPLFESALSLDPGNATAHFNCAVALMRSGERDRAITAFKRVVQLQPTHAKAWFNLAVLTQASARPADALQIWRQLTDGDPTSQPAESRRNPAPPPLAARLSPRMLTDAWFHRGEVALENRQAVEAEICFLNVVRLEPRNAVAWCNVGISRAEQVRRADALTALQIALKLDPDLVPALNQAAYIQAANYRDTGDYECGRMVVEYCRRSLRLNPNQPNITALRRAASFFDPTAPDTKESESSEK